MVGVPGRWGRGRLVRWAPSEDLGRRAWLGAFRFTKAGRADEGNKDLLLQLGLRESVGA